MTRDILNPKKMVPPKSKKDTDKDTKEASKEVSEEQNKYEMMVILAPDLSQDQLDKELNKIRKQIKDLKGEIYHEDIWDIRDMAYIIKKYDKGYYVIFYLTINSSQLTEIEKEFHLDQKILRHLIVKSPKDYQIKKLADFELTKEDKRRPQAAEKKEEKKEAEKPVKEEKEEPKEEKVEEEASKEEPKEEIEEEPTEKEEEVEEKPKEEKTEEEKEVKEEKVEKEEEPKEEEKKKPAMDISDLDSKLESILDDPDIDIKI